MNSEKLSADALPAAASAETVVAFQSELESVFNLVTIALFVVDDHQRCLYMNSAAERMTGFLCSDFQGKALHELIYYSENSDEPHLSRSGAMEQAISQNIRQQGRDVFKHKNGHTYPVSYTVSPMGGQGNAETLIEIRDITEEQRDESSLQRDSFFELSLNLLAIADFNGYFVHLNPTWEKFLGFSEQELKSQCYLNFVHPDDRTATIAEAEKLVHGQEIVQFENRFRTKSGSYRWLQWNAVPLGKDLLYAIAQDITDSKLAEEVLRERSQRLRFMLNASKIGEWELDLTRYPHEARRSLRYDQIFGYDELLPEWNYEIFLNHVHPDDRDAVDQKFQLMLSTQADWEFECCIVHPDQSHHWIWGRGSIYHNTSNEPTRVLGMVIDISERKLALQQLRKSEERYRILTEIAPQAVWTSQSSGYITYLNQYWLDYMGLTFEETAGYSWITFLHPVDRSQVLKLWQQTANRLASQQDASEYEIEVRFRRPKDGAYRWFLVRGLPVYNEAGQIDRWIGAAINIHERKAAEADKEQLLEQEKAARTAAERANQIKDEFLAVLSHELRSPLNPILGWSQLLQQGDLDAETTALGLKTIERNVQLQVQLIDDLLDISRILRGKLTLKVTPVELSFIVEAAFETVRLAAQAKALEVEFSLVPLLVNGDDVRLQQVIWNLLSNAVKFTQAGGQVWLTLSQEKDNAKIQVRDTGKGINPSFLAHVFDHFQQEDGATTRMFGGLGLGLAIARQIVEMHGGTIEAESPGEGQGATFTVRLPLSPQPADLLYSKLPTTDSISLEGLNILVVDDESDSRDFLVLALQQAKARVTTASSGPEALRAISASAPDILISDIGMPEMSGYSLIQQIRQLPTEAGGRIPAIALTAYASQLDQDKVIEAGFQCHLSKPVHPKVLISKIIQLMGSIPHRE